MLNDHLAKEADRLKNDEIFNMALDRIRAEALEGLAQIDADDITAVLKLQCRVFAVDEIRSTLDAYILAADVPEDAGSFA
jgi:ketosteroid isomerase-like protein